MTVRSRSKCSRATFVRSQRYLDVRITSSLRGARCSKANVPKLDPREEHFCIAGPRAGLQLFLRRLSPAPARAQRSPVLYVHGGTFPSALSIAHRFDGKSWRDALCEAGFDVWGFDFHGFGAFRPLSGDGRSRPRRIRRSAVRRGCSGAARGRGALHSRAAGQSHALAHLAFLGLDAGRALRRRASRAGRPSRPVRSDRAPGAAALREAADGAGLADRDARGPMDALHRGRAAQEPPVLVARAFRRMGRALSRQRSGRAARAIRSA